MEENIKNLKKRIKPKTVILAIIAVIVIIYTIVIFSITGFLQASSIDNPDLDHWRYNGGNIENTEEFTYVGNAETCWLLIHSYTATTKEMRELADSINDELGDWVFVQQLSGHGQVPSALEGKNLDVWYKEVEGKYDTLMGAFCNKINVVGSSFGSTLALRLAQEQEVKNVFILNPFLRKPYEFYKILPFETRTKLFSPILNYKKKKGNAKINSPEGLDAHIAYFNMPYQPIKDSLPFIEETISNLNKIENPTLIAFSVNDEVAGDYSAMKIHDDIISENKVLLNYPNSNHVLLMDYDKGRVMRDIITFEIKNRNN
tara:strand:- start:615 stop:1562 length:948 start_codon:yes stop_codon:yes gene_type:complete